MLSLCLLCVRGGVGKVDLSYVGVQERAPALLADNPDYRGLSVSLSAGVCTERTVVGLLSSEDTEYQCVGDAVTEAHLLATMFHEVLMAAWC